MSNVDTVYFDLDGTLCVSNQSDTEIYQEVFERVGIDLIFEATDIRAVDSADIQPANTDAEFYTNLYRATVSNLSTDFDSSLLVELGEATTEIVDKTDVSFRWEQKTRLITPENNTKWG